MEKSKPKTKANNNKYSVIVVEDEENIADFMSAVLETHGYAVRIAQNAATARLMIGSYMPDIVILDLGLPDEDGINIIKSVRETSRMPILVVSVRTHEADKVEALDCGADDYITKPFGTAELLARVRTALRHAHRAESIRSSKTPFRADGLLVDYDKRRVLVDGEEIHFTQKEFNLISLLSVHAGRVLTYDFLMRNIWGTVPADSENSILRVNMASIRRKIEKDPAEPKYILTEMGVGYRMIEGD